MLHRIATMGLLVGAGLGACRPELAETAPSCEAEPQWARVVPPPVAGQYPQFRLEPKHRGQAPPGTFIGPELALTWASAPYAIGDYSASKGSPSFDGERVYAAFDDGYLRAFDPEDGSLAWELALPRAAVEASAEDTENNLGSHSTPAVGGGRVFIGDYSGWLTAADARTGALLWQVKLGGSIGASPLLFDGKVFISVEYPDPDGKAFVLDAAEGCVLRETDFLGNHPHGSPSLDPARGLLFVGANNGRFQAFDYVHERVWWNHWMDEDPVDGGLGAIKTTAAVGPDTVYINSWDRKLHAINIENGRDVFVFETGSRVMSSPALDGDQVLFGSHDGHLYALQAAGADAGRLNWSLDLERAITSSPTVLPEAGVVLVGAHDGAVHMADLQTGEPLWEAQLDALVTSVPIAVDGTVFVTDAAGVLWRFDQPAD